MSINDDLFPREEKTLNIKSFSRCVFLIHINQKFSKIKNVIFIFEKIWIISQFDNQTWVHDRMQVFKWRLFFTWSLSFSGWSHLPSENDLDIIKNDSFFQEQGWTFDSSISYVIRRANSISSVPGVFFLVQTCLWRSSNPSGQMFF